MHDAYNTGMTIKKQTLRQKLNSLKKLDYSDAAIAKIAGCHQSTINRIKNGDTLKPTYEVRVNICALYNEVVKE